MCPVEVVSHVEHRISIFIHFSKLSQVREIFWLIKISYLLLSFQILLWKFDIAVDSAKSWTVFLIGVDTEITFLRNAIKNKSAVDFGEGQLSREDSIKLCVCWVDGPLLVRSLNVNFFRVVSRTQKLLFGNVLVANILATEVVVHLSTSLS